MDSQQARNHADFRAQPDFRASAPAVRQVCRFFRGLGYPQKQTMAAQKKLPHSGTNFRGRGTSAAQANSSFSLPVLALAHRLMNEVDAVQIVSDTLPASVS